MQFPLIIKYLMCWSNFMVPVQVNLLVHSTIIIAAGLWGKYLLRGKVASAQSRCLQICLIAVILCPLSSLIFTATRINVYTINNASLAEYENIYIHQISSRRIPITIPVKGFHPHKIDTSLGVEKKSEIRYTPSQEKYIEDSDVNNDSFLQILRKNSKACMYMMLFIIWVVFSLILLVKAIVHNLYIKYLRFSAFEAKPIFTKLCTNVAYELGIKPPKFLQSFSVKSTFLSGFLHPSIILPAGEHESAMASREVILHELAHLIRRDYLWNLLCQIGKIIVPFQPLLWVLSHHIEETSDYVCDDYVIIHGNNSRRYAMQLLNLAESLK